MKERHQVSSYGWQNGAPCNAEYIVPIVLNILKGINVNRVLDLGSGNGHLCESLHAQGYDAVGMDCDKEGVKIAREHYSKIPFYQYGVEDDPACLMSSEKPFDAVVSTEVIEHLFSPHLLPIYAHRVLKKGGFLIVSTPYHGYIKNLLLALLNKWDFHHKPLWHGGHVKFWSKATLTELLETNGFKVLSFKGAGRFTFLWKSMILVARKI